MANTKKSKVEPTTEAETKPELKVDEPAEVSDPKTEAPLAKAGKHSAKALKEIEEKQAKEARKATKAPATADLAKQSPKKPPRSRTERAGKKYRELAKLIDKTKSYELQEAVELVAKSSPTKFDATLEIHVNLNVDPTQADQNIRGTLALPAGSGKTLRIAVLADSDDSTKAKTAGATLVGEDILLAALEKQSIDFDILITTPSMMPKLGKYARLLGPRGLMPNPKSGTVTTDVVKAVAEAKSGRVEYRVDPTGIVHAGIGKVSFGAAKLQQNTDAILTNIKAAKPATIKGPFIKSIYLTTTMGPAVKVANDNS